MRRSLAAWDNYILAVPPQRAASLPPCGLRAIRGAAAYYNFVCLLAAALALMCRHIVGGGQGPHLLAATRRARSSAPAPCARALPPPPISAPQAAPHRTTPARPRQGYPPAAALRVLDWRALGVVFGDYRAMGNCGGMPPCPPQKYRRGRGGASGVTGSLAPLAPVSARCLRTRCRKCRVPLRRAPAPAPRQASAERDFAPLPSPRPGGAQGHDYRRSAPSQLAG